MIKKYNEKKVNNYKHTFVISLYGIYNSCFKHKNDQPLCNLREVLNFPYVEYLNVAKV